MSRMHRLIWSLFLISHPAWAEKLPIPPIPPAHVPRVKLVPAPNRNAHPPMKTAWATKISVPPIRSANAPRAQPAPVPDRGAHPPRNIASAQKMPAPPVPTVNAPWTELAPMPDRDAHPPTNQDASSLVNVSVTDFRTTTIDNSAGFAGGSRYRSAEDLRAIQTPGLKLTVPLQLP